MVDFFEKKSKEVFSFLEDEYSFRIIDVNRAPYGISVVYQNETTGVEVRFEDHENKVFVLLSRLVNGKLPEYPLFVTPETKVDIFYLDSLLALRSPSTSIRQKGFDERLKPEELEDILMAYANALKKHGVDILEGDFTVFAELERRLKARIENK